MGRPGAPALSCKRAFAPEPVNERFRDR